MRLPSRTITISWIVLLTILLCNTVIAFLAPQLILHASHSSLLATSVKDENVLSSSPQFWADRALLLSSFQDGLVSSPKASSFLRDSLLRSLSYTDSESSSSSSSSLSSSSFASDGICRAVYIPTASYAYRSDSSASKGKQRQRNRADGRKRRKDFMTFVHGLMSGHRHRCGDGENDSFVVRSSFSSSSPSDDDNRNINDNNNFDSDIPIAIVTLDLEDESVRHPEIISTGSLSSANTKMIFPTEGRKVLNEWGPHLIYVEGGNTFWLGHCLAKRKDDDGVGWIESIRSACCSSSSSLSSPVSSPPAVYVGKSAGAIVAGAKIDTALWKGWDDPSVVPGLIPMETKTGDINVSEAKIKVEGSSESSTERKALEEAVREQCHTLNMAGGASFFPHMEDVWKKTVIERTAGWKNDDDNDNSCNGGGEVYPLREWEACCVSNEGGTGVNGVREIVSAPCVIPG